MKKYYGYISKDKISSLFGYELSLRDKNCRPAIMGEDDKKFYSIYFANDKPKGIGRNKEIFEGEIYLLPNQIKPHF